MRRLNLFYPVKAPKGYPLVSQKFGPSPLSIYKELGMKGHNGIDYPCPRGTPVRATHDGIVAYAGGDNKEGYGVVIRTIEPFAYQQGEAYYKTIYWHLLLDIPVKVNTQVKTGDIIAYADNTGLSTGDHLHFGLKPQVKGENDWTWWNWEQENGYYGAIDPAPYFNNFYAEDEQTIISILRQQISIYQKLIELFKKVVS